MRCTLVCLFVLACGVNGLALVAGCRRSDSETQPKPQALVEPAANVGLPPSSQTTQLRVFSLSELTGGASAPERTQQFLSWDDMDTSGAATVAQRPTTPASLPAPADLPELVARVKPFVVTIIVYGPDDKPIGQGSGFWLGRDKIVTNHHVVAGGVRATAQAPKDEPVPVLGVLASDSENDLVLLSARRNWWTADEASCGCEVISLAEKLPREGEQIVVIGSPKGLEHTVSTGIVSSIRPSDDGLTQLQITAPISHGSSGSPVLDMQGRVVGVAVSVLEEGQLLNFAVPVTALRAMKPGKVQTFDEWGLSGRPTEFALGEAAYLAKDFALALSYFRFAEKRSPHDSTVHARLGDCLLMSGSRYWNDAETHYLKAIELGNSDWTVITGLGSIYRLPGPDHHYAPDKSVDIYRRGIRLHPEDARLHAGLADALVEFGHPHEALQSWKLATDLAPNDIAYLKSFGDVFQKLGRGADASAAYHRAIKIKPTDADDYVTLGQVFKALGDKSTAIHTYERGLEHYPDYSLLHAQLGGACMESDPDKAANHLEVSTRAGIYWAYNGPNSPLLYSYRRCISRPRRIAAQKDAIRNAPDDPYAHLFLSMLLTVQGDRAGALEEYNVLKRLNPDLAESLFEAIYP